MREHWTGPGKAGPGRCFGPARVGLQGKEKRGRYRLVGLKTRRGKEKVAFLKLIQTNSIQFKFKFREFKFKLNKQIK